MKNAVEAAIIDEAPLAFNESAASLKVNAISKKKLPPKLQRISRSSSITEVSDRSNCTTPGTLKLDDDDAACTPSSRRLRLRDRFHQAFPGSKGRTDFAFLSVSPRGCFHDDYQKKSFASRVLVSHYKDSDILPVALLPTAESCVWAEGEKSQDEREIRDLLSGTPNCSFIDYNMGYWAEDIFALPHNAVRCELSEMFVMFEAMVQVGARLTYGDVFQIARWMMFFTSFFTCICVHERETLFPYVLDAGKSDRRTQDTIEIVLIQQEIIEKECRTIVELFSNISLLIMNKDSKVQKVRGLLTRAVKLATFFASHIIEYYGHQELNLPHLVYAQYQEADKVKRDLHIKIVEEMMISETPKLFTVALLRWIKAKDLQMVLTNYVPPTVKVPYMMWQKKFQAKHRRIVEDLVAKTKC